MSSEDNQMPLPVVHLQNDRSASSCVSSLREVDDTSLPQSQTPEAEPDTAAMDVVVEHGDHLHYEDVDGSTTTTPVLVLESDSRVRVDKCSFHVKRKRRNCNARTVGGRDYCIEHSYLMGVSVIVRLSMCSMSQ